MTKYKETIKKMTFEEKAMLLTGGAALSTCENERLNIPKITMSDGPHGVRTLTGNDARPNVCNINGGDVCYPTASAMGATWNTDLARETGAAIARDCIKEGIDVLLAPAVNMKRVPHCGRNFEYYSEDPVLSGKIAAQFICGIQENGVGTSLKHYAANNQETDRGTINAEVDERTLREYYLKVFEIAVKEGSPVSVMCAYNKLCGIWCSENKYLLNDILRQEWGYDGLTVSDWGAVYDIGKAVAAGLDLQMPRNKNIVSELKKALKLKTVTQEQIDRAAENVLKFADRVKNLLKNDSEYDRKKQHAAAYNAAAEAVTLLKNDNKILPIDLKKTKKIAVFGEGAKYPVFMGGGSSGVSVEAGSVDIPLDFIRKNVSNDTEVAYCEKFVYEDGFFSGTNKFGGVSSAVKEIKQTACGADIALVFVSDNYGREAETEELDRQNLALPNFINYTVNLVQSLCENVVVIMQTGSCIIPHLWHKKVKGIIQMWYAGEACGSVIADVLFGKINPSGKLSETFLLKPRTDIDYPGDGVKVCYSEKSDVGYRYYDKHREDVWYPFGYGMSYTTFKYYGLKLGRKKAVNEEIKIPVSFKIKNTGKTAGKEAVQLYIAPCDSVVDRPLKELKRFEKVSLLKGEEKEVSFILTKEDFCYYNICKRSWHVESGEYKILIAASSWDIILEDTVYIYSDTDYSKNFESGAMVL